MIPAQVLLEKTDVLVVGGGPAGSAAALTLARAGCRCAVLESQAVPGWKIGETLAPEARPLLQRLGVGEIFAQGGHRMSPGSASAWGREAVAEKNFIFNPHGGAWQLDRARFDAMLLGAAESAGAQVSRGHAVETVRRGPDGWEVTAGERQFRAAWLVDASGRGSILARQLGATREILDKLVSVHAVATAVEADTDARTWIEAGAEGWWYSALVPDGRRVFSFQTDADLLPGQEWRTAAWWRSKLDESRPMRALADVAGRGFEHTPRLTSAHSGRLEIDRGDGWVAVGDAARSFDPLSGQGIFHGLLTGAEAAAGLLKVMSGAPDGLEAYTALGNDLWQRFLRHRWDAYASETRWAGAPFWQRRARGPTG